MSTRGVWRQRRLDLPAALTTLLLVGAARADERRWQLEASASMVALEHQRPALLLMIAGSRWWPINQGADVGVGASISAFGLGAGSRWIGALTGPTASVRVRVLQLPGGFLSVGWTITADVGCIPVCDRWLPSICPRRCGLFPLLSPSASYATDRYSVGAAVGLRHVNTAEWIGLSVEPAVTMRVSW